MAAAGEVLSSLAAAGEGRVKLSRKIGFRRAAGAPERGEVHAAESGSGREDRDRHAEAPDHADPVIAGSSPRKRGRSYSSTAPGSTGRTGPSTRTWSGPRSGSGEEADIVAHVVDDRAIGRQGEDAIVRGILENLPVPRVLVW